MGWSSPNALAVASRRPGSTITATPGSTFNSAANQQGWFSTGVTQDTATPPVLHFDINVTNPTSLVLYLIGYYGPETSFFNDAIAVTIPTGDLSVTPGTIDISAQCPGAVAVIADLWGNSARIVPHGDPSPTSYLPSGNAAQSVICGVSGGKIDLIAAAGTTPTLYLRGYMRARFFWRSPAVDVSPATAAAFTAVAAGGTYSDTPVGFLYQARGTPNFTVRGPYATTGYNPQKAAQNGSCLAIADGPIGQVNPATVPFTLAEQAYFTAGAAVAAGPPTAVHSNFAIRTTSQS